MKLYEKLSLYVKSHGIKQTWLADQVGETVQKINAILLGRQGLTADMFEKICIRGLKVNPSIFFDNSFLESKKTGTDN